MRTCLSFLVILWFTVVMTGQSPFAHLRGDVGIERTGDVIQGPQSLNDEITNFDSRVLSRRPPLSLYRPEYKARKLDSVVLMGVTHSSGELFNAYKGTFEYDEEHRLSSEVISTWYKGPHRWLDIFRSVYEYDEFGQLIRSLNYELDEFASEFLLAYQTEFEWYGKRLASSIEYRWDPGKGDWTPVWRTDHDYESRTGKEKVTVEYSWNSDSDSWYFESKYESEYHTSGDLYTYKAYQWDDGYNIWQLDWIREFSYDRNHHLIEQLNIELVNSLWIPVSKYQFDYDIYGDITKEIFYEWNADLRLMVALWKDEFDYDTEHAITTITTWLWDHSQALWTEDRQLVYEHDKKYNYENLLLPPTLFEDDAEQKVVFRFMVLNTYVLVWDEDDGGWKEGGDIKYFYSGLSSSDTDQHLIGLNFYPNPTTGTIRINDANTGLGNADIEIFDMQGRRVPDLPWLRGDQIDLGHLKKGVYLIRFMVGDNAYEARVVQQ